MDELAYVAVRFATHWFLRLYFGLRVIGRTPKEGAFILAANHTSFLDAFLVAASCRRRVRFIMTELYAGLPGAGWFLRWNRVILVRENGDNRSMLRTALRALQAGEVVGIFPEGGISEDGILRDVQPGVVALAMRGGVPVVPMGIQGAHRALPRWARVPRPHTISIRIGDPIAPPDLVPSHLPRADGLREGADRLKEEMARLLA